MSLHGESYAPLFCEENIQILAKRMLAEGSPPDTLRVLFFSNPGRQVVMLKQRRADDRGFVVWDYHVVLQAGRFIYDFDSVLPFPVNSVDYFLDSFPEQSALAERYRAWVRWIPAAVFTERFYSDRSHMRGVIDEAEFPLWPVMSPAHDQAIALSEYWDMCKALDDGSEIMGVSAYLNLLEREAAG